MRRVVFICILLFAAFAVGAHAQETTAAGNGLVGYGFKAGVGLANLSGSVADAITDLTGASKKMKIGFGFGAFLTYAFSPMFAVQPELLYTMKGAKYELGAESAKLNFNYLQIPVLLKLTPEVQGNIKPFIFAGPALSFLMSANVSDGGSVDVKDAFKSTEFGILFGAGADFPMSRGKITIDGRYDLGLSNLPKEIGGVTPDMKTSTISFMIGYSFK
jgi:hypothetical protein